MRRYLLPSALATITIGIASCGASNSDDDTTPAAEGYPVTVDNCHGEVTLDDRPERIVSLNQGTTEILLSLGVGDRMVGTATWTDPVLTELEEANAKIERLADNNASLESVLDVEPDFVTASFTGTLDEGGTASAEQFADYGIPSYLSPAECGKAEEGNTDGERTDVLEMDDIYTEIRELAELTGTVAEGEELITDLQSRMEAASAQKIGEGVTIMYWFANSESPYMAGCCGGPGVINRALGLENIYEGETAEWPQISWEAVAAADPDVLVIGDLTRKSQTAETAEAKIAFLESHPVTSQMTAVKNQRYILLAGAELNPSIRTVDAIEKVAEGLREFGLAS